MSGQQDCKSFGALTILLQNMDKKSRCNMQRLWCKLICIFLNTKRGINDFVLFHGVNFCITGGSGGTWCAADDAIIDAF